MGKSFVIGDIHGACRALKQCLEHSGFDYENDTLICLGDVCDGWPETNQAIEELLRIRNLVYLLGNHDFWTLEWMQHHTIDSIWYDHGGKATVQSYEGNVPATHINFLKEARLFYTDNNRLFVHAGINPTLSLEQQSLHDLIWDRTFVRNLQMKSRLENPEPLTSFDEVYIGHTPVAGDRPLHIAEVWMMDTGAGWSGVLSMMNIESKETFSSDPVPSLYPGIEGRKKK